MKFIKRGVAFFWAYSKWIAAGSPLRDDEYIFRLYDDFCSQCPTNQFIQTGEGRGECNQCGCHILRISSKETKLNKLAFPTEGCPDGHWDADINEEEE